MDIGQRGHVDQDVTSPSIDKRGAGRPRMESAEPLPRPALGGAAGLGCPRRPLFALDQPQGSLAGAFRRPRRDVEDMAIGGEFRSGVLPLPGRARVGRTGGDLVFRLDGDVASPRGPHRCQRRRCAPPYGRSPAVQPRQLAAESLLAKQSSDPGYRRGISCAALPAQRDIGRCKPDQEQARKSPWILPVESRGAPWGITASEMSAGIRPTSGAAFFAGDILCNGARSSETPFGIQDGSPAS
jgi:hypothetical protein